MTSVKMTARLMDASEGGDCDVIKDEFDNGRCHANATTSYSYGRTYRTYYGDMTALMIAAFNGKKEAVELCLDMGADATLKGTDFSYYDKHTARDFAIKQGHNEIAEILLRAEGNSRHTGEYSAGSDGMKWSCCQKEEETSPGCTSSAKFLVTAPEPTASTTTATTATTPAVTNATTATESKIDATFAAMPPAKVETVTETEKISKLAEQVINSYGI